MKKNIVLWLPLALTITLLCLIVYVSVQQVLRLGANDPQIQIARDYADQKDSNLILKNIKALDKVDIDKSLNTFVMDFNQKGTLLESNGYFYNSTPQLPSGVFKDNIVESKFTWEPESNVRIALVLEKTNTGYIAVGRSLKEVEAREDQLGRDIAVGWIFTLIISFISLVGANYFLKRNQS